MAVLMPNVPPKPAFLMEGTFVQDSDPQGFVGPWFDVSELTAIQVAAYFNVGSPRPSVTVEEGIFTPGTSNGEPRTIRYRSLPPATNSVEAYAEVPVVGRYARIRCGAPDSTQGGYVVSIAVRGVQ